MVKYNTDQSNEVLGTPSTFLLLQLHGLELKISFLKNVVITDKNLYFKIKGEINLVGN